MHEQEMKRTVVISVVGLTRSLIGVQMPFLEKWVERRNVSLVKPILPAVTCSMQSTYLTGKMPSEHGIVGNGWYFKDEAEVKFWRQSNKLVRSPKIWEILKAMDPSFTCANMFWWYNMYSSVNYSVTPRPQYHADGKKMPDIYTEPPALRDELQEKFGIFPLFDFWGPKTSIRSSQWIAKAAMEVELKYKPTLSLVYLPHLDYCFQRNGKSEANNRDLAEIDSVCEELISFYEKQNVNVIVLSEYGITPVDQPVHINKLLRKEGLLKIRVENGRELLDAGASDAFAVADHQVAHVYVKRNEDLSRIREMLMKTDGIQDVYDNKMQKEQEIDHERSGDLVCVADKNAWFTYYYWLDDKLAPDFARTVDIHRKPGYDPCELFLDPSISMPALKVGSKLVKKKLGFRYLMDVIPLNADLVKGSHGRIPESKEDWPLFISEETTEKEIKATEVFRLLKNSVTGN